MTILESRRPIRIRDLGLKLRTVIPIFIVTIVALIGLASNQWYGNIPLKSPSELNFASPDATCRQDNLYLLKMPKTGSTTMLNILFRVALRRELRMTTYSRYLPSAKEADAMVRFLKPKFVVGKSRKYNMHGVHSWYDREYIQQILYSPHANVTFIRHPVARTRSHLYQLHLVQSLKLKGPDPLVDFLYNIDRFSKKSPDRIHKTRNQMTDLLRINTTFHENSREFENESLREIERTFIFGLTEHYTESLVLIRRRLCWSLRDVIHVPLHLTHYKGSADPDSTKLNTLMCAWASLDCKLYDYFNRSFWKAIGKEGPGFNDEVVLLNQILDKTYHYCMSVYKQLKGNAKHIRELNEVIPPISFEKSEWNERVDLGVYDCALMRLGSQWKTLVFYIQNPEECELLIRHNDKDFLIKGKAADIWTDICLSINDTDKMVWKLLEHDSVYRWR